jgi:hypothetical protein
MAPGKCCGGVITYGWSAVACVSLLAHTRPVLTSSSATGRAVQAVADAVESALAPVGWRRRHLASGLPFDTFTLDMGDGIIATAELQRPVVSIGTQWPSEVSIELGVGFEPALGLMPLVALPAMPMLLHNPATRGDAGEIELQGEHADQRAAAVREIVAFIADHAAAFADRYDPGSLAGELGQLAERAAATDGEWWQRRHLIMLAVLDRRDETGTLLAAYERRYSSGAGTGQARRFARQLRRRLADMPSPMPAAEDTLAQLPPRRPRPGGSKLRIDAAWRRKRDRAIKAVKSRAGGHSLAELREMLAREYEAHGVDVPSSAIALAAEKIDAERKPLGGVEYGLRTLWQVGSAVGDLIHTFTSHLDTTEPEWMNPPDRAAFEIETSDDRVIPVAVDTDAHEYLSRACADGLHVGRFANIPVWLSAPDPADGHVVVHLGDRRIGTVLAADLTVLATAFQAAAIFDEDVTLRAHLYQTTDGVDIVELWVGDLYTTPEHHQPTRGAIDNSQDDQRDES